MIVDVVSVGTVKRKMYGKCCENCSGKIEGTIAGEDVSIFDSFWQRGASADDEIREDNTESWKGGQRSFLNFKKLILFVK